MSKETLPTPSYPERAARAKSTTDEARLKHAKELFVRFKADSQDIQFKTVSAVNVGREIGLELDDIYLPPNKELAEAHFREHYQPKVGFDYFQFLKFISISRKLPEPAVTLEDAIPALQLTFFASNLLEAGERTEQQTHHYVTPSNLFSKELRGVKTNLIKVVKDADKWDSLTRNRIRELIEEHEAWLEKEVKPKL